LQCIHRDIIVKPPLRLHIVWYQIVPYISL
jgi:hypothetical protein